MEKCYTVAETVKLTGVKSYVLRYWEEELELHVGRTNLGHRCYTEEDIRLILNVKELKNRGLQLRAIKELLPKISCKEMLYQDLEKSEKIRMLEMETAEKKENLAGAEEGKGQAEKRKDELESESRNGSEAEDQKKSESIERKHSGTEDMKKSDPEDEKDRNQEADKILEFQEILERLITQELHAKKEGEDRWRSLDAAIRRQQLARKEAAASLDKKGKKHGKGHK